MNPLRDRQRSTSCLLFKRRPDSHRPRSRRFSGMTRNRGTADAVAELVFTRGLFDSGSFVRPNRGVGRSSKPGDRSVRTRRAGTNRRREPRRESDCGFMIPDGHAVQTPEGINAGRIGLKLRMPAERRDGFEWELTVTFPGSDCIVLGRRSRQATRLLHDT